MLSKNRIKYIQSLVRKKDREIHRCFIAETPKVVNEFLNSSYKTEAILGTRSWIAENRDKIDQKIELTEVKDDEFSKISQLKNPHDVLAVIRMPEQSSAPDLKGRLSIALDDLQDPGNMGTVLRIADWFGIENVICSLNTVDAFNCKVVQASMGSIAHIRISYVDLEAFLKESAVPAYVAVLDGISVYEVARPHEGILVTGNEGKGIRKSIVSLAAEKISVPRLGKAESLNAAVATGIIVSHLIKP